MSQINPPDISQLGELLSTAGQAQEIPSGVPSIVSKAMQMEDSAEVRQWKTNEAIAQREHAQAMRAMQVDESLSAILAKTTGTREHEYVRQQGQLNVLKQQDANRAAQMIREGQSKTLIAEKMQAIAEKAARLIQAGNLTTTAHPELMGAIAYLNGIEGGSAVATGLTKLAADNLERNAQSVFAIAEKAARERGVSLPKETLESIRNQLAVFPKGRVEQEAVAQAKRAASEAHRAESGKQKLYRIAEKQFPKASTSDLGKAVEHALDQPAPLRERALAEKLATPKMSGKSKALWGAGGLALLAMLGSKVFSRDEAKSPQEQMALLAQLQAMQQRGGGSGGGGVNPEGRSYGIDLNNAQKTLGIIQALQKVGAMMNQSQAVPNTGMLV